MHRLEREAQNDPFLMDAIDGYSLQDTGQQPQLDELQRRLQQRVNKGKVYQLPYRMAIAAAASVLVILSVAYLLWPSGRRAPVIQVAAVIPKTQAPPTGHDTLLKPGNEEQLATNTAAGKPPREEQIAQAAAPLPSNAPPSLMAVTTTPAADAKKPDTATNAASGYQPKPNDSLNTVMTLAAAKQPATVNANPANPQPVKMMRAAVMAKPATKINGIISDETGHPLAGASITEKGKSDGVKTDSKGKFSLPGQDGELLSITYPGYENKEVKGEISDSLNIILRPADKSISEMVAIGFGQTLAAKKIKAAHPQIGWANYNSYLKGRAIIADGKPGTVRLSFTVDGKGQLGDFIIKKALSPAADEMAISMVKSGPPWAPDVSGATKTISLKIEFKLQQP